MSNANAELPMSLEGILDLNGGSHVGYLFESHEEKQFRLFSICREAVTSGKASVVYVAGKQGTKGIRLSLIDAGFNLIHYQRKMQMKIVDSEEWFLTNERRRQFKPIGLLQNVMDKTHEDALAAGYGRVALILETDMLVRKGFLQKYIEFEEELSEIIKRIKMTVICAFDKRELLAAGVTDPAAVVSKLHTMML